MHGIVSLLDKKHDKQVRDLWAELAITFNVHGIETTPWPHFSYQVSEYYDTNLLESILQNFVQDYVEFRVHTSGLGLFTGSKPVLYIPLVRAQELSRFHRALWREVTRAARGVEEEYYHPKNWMPHITLAQHDIHQDNLAEIIRRLSGRMFNWTININSVAFIHDTGDHQELKSSFRLRRK